MSGPPSRPASEGSYSHRPEARKHHQAFKHALVTRALHRPAELLSLCSSEALAVLWHEVGAPLASEERCAPDGLGVRVLGDAEGPVVMINMPAPERPNEAYYLCAVPAGSRVAGKQLVPPHGPEGTSCFRVFGMERSLLPDGGTIGFVVEWTASRRRNYDAPNDPSPGAFWEAVAQVVAGTRTPLHTAPSSLAETGAEPTSAQAAAAAVAELDRATWLACVGRPLVRGFPERFAKARLVETWDEAFAMLAIPERFDAVSAPMIALRAAIGDAAYGPAIARIAATTQALLRRKFPQVLATAEQDNALAKSVQLDLIGALLAIEESARVRFPIASDLLFLYSEGRLPCAWDSGGITALF